MKLPRGDAAVANEPTALASMSCETHIHGVTPELYEKTMSVCVKMKGRTTGLSLLSSYRRVQNTVCVCERDNVLAWISTDLCVHSVKTRVPDTR